MCEVGADKDGLMVRMVLEENNTKNKQQQKQQQYNHLANYQVRLLGVSLLVLVPVVVFELVFVVVLLH